MATPEDPGSNRLEARKDLSHQFRSALFWIAAAIAVAITLLPITPLLIYLLIPFPELHETTHWVGQVKVIPMQAEGNRVKREQLFMLTADGKTHEFACGLLGARYGCPRYAAMNGAVGEVWFSDTYGAVQWRLTLAEGWQKGKQEVSEISEWKQYYRTHFRLDKYLSRLALPAIALAIVVWQVRRRRQSKI